jgi:L-fuculose-phosphate aldolase
MIGSLIERSYPTGVIDEAALKSDLVLACRILADNGHADSIFGHVSARLPGWDRLWMKGAGVGLDEVTEADLVLIDFAGARQSGTRGVHEEYPIHAEIMRARPDVLCVVHTHPPFGIVFASRGLELRPVSHEGSFFWPPGVPTFSAFSDLVRTTEQGTAVASTLGDAKALFLRNHGIALAESSVDRATFATLMLERACELQLMAQPVRDAPFFHTPEDEARRKQRIWSDHPERSRGIFDYYARKLGERKLGR